MDRAKAILKECENRIVLDVGCGGGNKPVGSENWLHRKICNISKKCVGLEKNPERVNKMREMGYEVFKANAENFELDNKFEVIVAGELIEHLSNPGLFLESCRNHLKRNGRLVITTPNFVSLYKFYKENFADEERNTNHIIGFTPHLLENLLRKNNFEVIKNEKFDSEQHNTFRSKLFSFLTPRSFQGIGTEFG